MEALFLRLPLDDLLNLCQTNRFLNDLCQRQDLWRLKYQQDFPPTSDPISDWKKFYLQRHKYFANQSLLTAVKYGNVDDVRWDWVLAAFKIGPKSTVDFMIDAFEHRPDLVMRLYRQQKNSIISSLAKRGTVDQVDRILNLFPEERSTMLTMAIDRNNLPIVQHLFPTVPQTNLNLDFIIKIAARHGYSGTTLYLVRQDRSLVNQALLGAIEGGHVSLIMNLLQLGPTNLNEALAEVFSGLGPSSDEIRETIVQMLLNHGADIESAFKISGDTTYPEYRKRWLNILKSVIPTTFEDELEILLYEGTPEEVRNLLRQQRKRTRAKLEVPMELLKDAVYEHVNIEILKVILDEVKFDQSQLDQLLCFAAEAAEPDRILLLINRGAKDVGGAFMCHIDHYFEMESSPDLDFLDFLFPYVENKENLFGDVVEFARTPSLINFFRERGFVLEESPVDLVTPQPVVSIIPQPVVSIIPRPVVSIIPQPVVSIIPQPVVSIIPRPIVPATPRPPSPSP